MRNNELNTTSFFYDVSPHEQDGEGDGEEDGEKENED